MAHWVIITESTVDKMLHSMFLIFNHRITKIQEEDARRTLGVSRVVDMPAELKELWSNIPPELPELETYLGPVKAWLEDQAAESDYVLIQGDFGACFTMVNFSFDRGLIPVYSTTLREAVEEYVEDGTVRLVHQFKHQIFRRYGV